MRRSGAAIKFIADSNTINKKIVLQTTKVEMFETKDILAKGFFLYNA